MGATKKPTFAVYLDFGESDEEFYRRNPDCGRRHEGVVLRFGEGAEKFIRILRPE